MTDWIDDARKACEIAPVGLVRRFGDEDGIYSYVLTMRFPSQEHADNYRKALPRALDALEKAEALAKALEDWEKGKEPHSLWMKPLRRTGEP